MTILRIVLRRYSLFKLEIFYLQGVNIISFSPRRHDSERLNGHVIEHIVLFTLYLVSKIPKKNLNNWGLNVQLIITIWVNGPNNSVFFPDYSNFWDLLRGAVFWTGMPRSIHITITILLWYLKTLTLPLYVWYIKLW